MFSQNLTLQEAFQTSAHINEDLKRTEFHGAFCKKFRILIDIFSSFFPKSRKSVEKVIHQKEKRGNRTSTIVKSEQSYCNGHVPYHCSFHYLAGASRRANLRAR